MPFAHLGFSSRTTGILAACLTATCWSFLAILLKVTLKYADSGTIVWYRMVVASILTTGLLHHFGNKSSFKVLLQKPGALLVASLCLAVNYFGYMKGVDLTSPANAQIFIQLGPLMLAVAGVILFKETLNKYQIVGFLICIFGFGFFFVDKLSAVNGENGNYYLGQTWILLAAATWAAFATLQKSLLKTWNPNQINLYIYLVSSLVFTPLVDWQVLREASLWVHFLMAFLGFNTLLAYGSLSIALKNLPATQVSPIITLNPLLTLLLIFLLEKTTWNLIPADPLSAAGYTGALMAVLGVILVVTQRSATPPSRR